MRCTVYFYICCEQKFYKRLLELHPSIIVNNWQPNRDLIAGKEVLVFSMRLVAVI